MVALITSILASVLMTVGVLWYAKRRPVGTPVTWGEAMVGAVYVFFLAFLAYGVVPHQWLTLAENELGWRADRIVIGPGEIFKPKSQGGGFPFDITYRTVSDSIAGAFYWCSSAVRSWLWLAWQNRGDKASKAASMTSPRAPIGRPLVKQG